MSVEVHDGVASAGHLVLGHHQRRARSILRDARRGNRGLTSHAATALSLAAGGGERDACHGRDRNAEIPHAHTELLVDAALVEPAAGHGDRYRATRSAHFGEKRLQPVLGRDELVSETVVELPGIL